MPNLNHSKMRQCPVLVAAALLLLGAGADALARDIRLSGMGVRQCGEWTQWKTDNKGEARALTLEWAQGFIAGHNVYARIANNQPANSVVADVKVLSPLIDAYCQRNPQGRVLAAVIEITQSLGGAKVNLAPKAPPGKDPQPDPSRERES